MITDSTMYATRDAILAALPVSDLIGDEVDIDSLREALTKAGWSFTGAPCQRCEGCGKIANSDRGEPWTVWENLPLRSAGAVLLGLVQPIPCPDCTVASDVQRG